MRLFPRIGWSEVARVALIAVGAAAVASFFFAPRFVIWRGLAVEPAWVAPELNRAVDALRQLEDPFGGVRAESNLVIRWRLFFPVLGHALGLPPAVYLALPMAGGLLTLAFAVRVCRRHGWSGWEAFGAAVVLATCSWYFVATGWLAYFDAWCVLGLLAVGFARPTWAVVAAVLVTPWIDERFVLALPLALLARDRYEERFALRPAGEARWRTVAWAAAALLPWALVRAWFFLRGEDPVTGSYVAMMIEQSRGLRPAHYARGLWEGLRWAWLPVVAWLVLEAREKPWRLAVLLPVLAAALGLNLMVAHDFSRTASVALPAVLLGLLRLRRDLPLRAAGGLALVGVGNLAFPARHVIADWSVPIRYWHAAFDERRTPPDIVNPVAMNDQAVKAARRGELARAEQLVGWALQLDPDYAEAHRNRALLAVARKRFDVAAQAVAAALRLRPEDPLNLLTRARLRAATGDLAGARADFAAAMAAVPRDWPHRAEAETLRQQIEAAAAGGVAAGGVNP